MSTANMKGFKISVCFLLSLYIIGFNWQCKSDILANTQHLKDVKGDSNNRLRKQKKINDLIFDVQYQQPNKITKDITKQENEFHYINLRLSVEGANYGVLKHNLSNYNEYAKRLHYFAYEMNQDIFLIEDGDTLACDMYHFERTYDLAKYNYLSLGFKRKKKEKNEKSVVLLIDSPVLNTGPVKIAFKAEDLQNIHY